MLSAPVDFSLYCFFSVGASACPTSISPISSAHEAAPVSTGTKELPQSLKPNGYRQQHLPTGLHQYVCVREHLRCSHGNPDRGHKSLHALSTAVSPKATLDKVATAALSNPLHTYQKYQLECGLCTQPAQAIKGKSTLCRLPNNHKHSKRFQALLYLLRSQMLGP